MISPDKVDRILRLLQSWSRKSTCTRRELESLIGSLHHACRVVVPGRTFLRRMIDLLCSFRNRNHPIRLNLEIRRDLQWWLSFFQDWNGMSFFLSPSVSPLPDLVVSSDASGTWGSGLSGAASGFLVRGFSFLLVRLSPSWNWFPSWLQRIFGGLRGLACVFSFYAITGLWSIFECWYLQVLGCHAPFAPVNPCCLSP